MKILFVANPFLPATGGTEIFNGEMARSLAGRGHELLLVTWSRPDGKDRPFPVLFLDREEEPGSYPCERVGEILARCRPDVALISRTMRRLSPLPGLFQQAGVPYVAYCHFLRSKHATRSRFRKRLARRRYGFEQASLVLAVSGYLAEQLHLMGVPWKRLRVVPPGVDSELFRPDPELRERMRRELGIEGRSVIVTVARLIHGKGHDRVLRALARLLPEFPELFYLIVGDGSRRTELESLARALRLERHVRFTGFVEDPRPHLVASDLFAHPSNRTGYWAEAFGLSTLEAAACGLPAVASCRGGARDIVQDGVTGTLLNESDPKELTDALRRLLSDRTLREAYGKAAREHVLANNSWSRSAARLETALCEAAAPSPLVSRR